MSKLHAALALTLSLFPSASIGADLSRYRSFQLGTDLATVATLAGVKDTAVKTVHRRPALVQEVEWRPRSLGSPGESEPAKEMAFTFYNGELFRIAIHYDRYETEGLTADDLIEAISATYGAATRPTASPVEASERFGNLDTIVGRWEDSLVRLDLIRSSYGPAFKLIAVLKKLEAPMQAAVTEAVRLDEMEAPQREAQRNAKNVETEKAKLEKARSVNKAKFRP
jgi:hypothetical protein